MTTSPPVAATAVPTFQTVCNALHRLIDAARDETGTEDPFYDALTVIQAYAQASAAPAVAGTHKLVPVEPTPEMCLAAKRERETYPVRADADSPVVLYRAMLNAAPDAGVAGDAAPTDQSSAGIDVLSLLQRARLYTNTVSVQHERGPFAVFRSELDAAIAALEKR